MENSKHKSSNSDHEDCNRSNLKVIQDELKLTKPYINILLNQLQGVLKETEEGILATIVKVNALDAAYKQKLDSNNQLSNNQDAEPLEILTDILGGLQFQDIVRQRLEQVCKALTQFEEHLAHLSETVVDSDWDGHYASSLKDKIERFSDDYVMLSQVETHLKVAEFAHKAHVVKSIELF